MNKVFCFGELLLRLSPSLNTEWPAAVNMPVYVGGAELNVAMALASWKIPVSYCTALPDNDVSKGITSYIGSKSIDTHHIEFCGNRIGLYYLQPGSELKNASVIYDRNYSSFSELKPGVLNWDKLLEGSNWFHFSAISPALNANVAVVCKEGLQAARRRNMTISVDLNYRARLWQYGQLPWTVMPELVNYCDVVMGNMWAARSLLNIPLCIEDDKRYSNEALKIKGVESMRLLKETFPSVKHIAYTFRMSDTYFALIQTGTAMATTSHEFPLKGIIDKAGSGDCFMAAFIFGLLHQHDATRIVNFAAAAAIGKMREKGDNTKQTIDAVNELLQALQRPLKA
jgi:2-dehydro-3-deoxygluconokinase